MSNSVNNPPVEAAIARLRAAMADVANGDIRAIKALYSHTEDATSFYGWGGWEKGWDAVSARWEWAGQQFRGGTVSYQSITCVEAPGLFYTTDVETFTMNAMDGMSGPTSWSNRVTHIFRLEEGEWRLLHRHGNRLEDQYKPANPPCPEGVDPMLFMVISTPRPEPPSAMTAKRKAYWEWLSPLQQQGVCKEVWARTGRGAIALFDVPDNETLHRIMNEWAEIIPATFEVYPLIDPVRAKAYLEQHKG